ncbi:hypothetical protein F5Y03DRAFT_82986 [Xylaria venustula]|nr:hypothetical protein F5Y03DRAFT_82986 [Xylaria venustula]
MLLYLGHNQPKLRSSGHCKTKCRHPMRDAIKCGSHSVAECIRTVSLATAFLLWWYFTDGRSEKSLDTTVPWAIHLLNRELVLQVLLDRQRGWTDLIICLPNALCSKTSLILLSYSSLGVNNVVIQCATHLSAIVARTGTYQQLRSPEHFRGRGFSNRPVR